MIGFTDELVRDSPHANEGPETRNMEKKAVYEMLALQYFLPPYNSRGITREYLIQVHREEVFRVRNSQVKHFEVDLTPAMTKRIGVLNNGLLVRKINKLLETRNQRRLGFSEFDPPDQVGSGEQVWLYRIARFIDETNLTEFFEARVTEEPPLSSKSSQISQTYFGRIKASKYFFQVKAAKSNRKLWEALRSISDTYRHLQSHLLTIEALNQEIETAKRRALEVGRNLEDMVSKAAFSYTTLQDPSLTAEAIIHGDRAGDSAVQTALHMNCKL